MPVLTAAVARCVASTRLQDVPADVVAWAKRALADTVACGLAAAGEEGVRLLRQTVPCAPGPSLAIGTGSRLHPLDAAQLSGAACHALDFDDCHTILDGHPTVPVAPALIALADARDASGAAVLQAYIAGIEAQLRLARLFNPDHLERGWHPTATIGILGCAAACARLLDLDAERTATALSIAASSASGLRANSGTMTKPLHAAMANRNGLQAALLAEIGFTANTTALEHKFGYAAAYNGRIPELDGAFDDWGQVFLLLTPGIAIKQYPCCAFIHSAIDAAAELRGQLAGPDDATAIKVHLHGRRLRNIDRPAPKDGLDARFSTQYLTARALLAGTVSLSDFESPMLDDGETLALARRVELVPHDDADMSLGRVEIATGAGNTIAARASVAMGRGPASPMSEDEFRRKFMDCASEALSDDASSKAYSSLMALEKVASIRCLTDSLERISND